MRDREQILLDAARWLHDFCGLEDLLNNHMPCMLRDVHKKLGRSNNRVEKAVHLMREAAGLRQGEPVWNMRGLLEALGVSSGIIGASFYAANFYAAAILVDRHNTSIENNFQQHFIKKHRSKLKVFSDVP